MGCGGGCARAAHLMGGVNTANIQKAPLREANTLGDPRKRLLLNFGHRPEKAGTDTETSLLRNELLAAGQYVQVEANEGRG